MRRAFQMGKQLNELKLRFQPPRVCKLLPLDLRLYFYCQVNVKCVLSFLFI